jgi:hypothetical protein
MCAEKDFRGGGKSGSNRDRAKMRDRSEHVVIQAEKIQYGIGYADAGRVHVQCRVRVVASVSLIVPMPRIGKRDPSAATSSAWLARYWRVARSGSDNE